MCKVEIPRQIDVKEILVRLLKTPVHYDPKRKVLKKDAFLPTSKEVDKVTIAGKTFSMPGISLLRLSYTDADTCKQHAAKILNPNTIPPETFAGLLLFKPDHVEEVCLDDTAKGLEKERIHEDAPVVLTHGTPMDDSSPDPKYIAEEVPVYKDSLGNPMHADIIYNFPRPEKGVPNNPLNKLAKTILDQVTRKGAHKFDSTEDPNVWGGDELTLI